MTSSREPALAGQTVAVLGGSAGIGLETARLARAEGAEVILAARNAERLEAAARDVGARTAVAFDANDPAALERFFTDLDGPVDHVMVTAGAPGYRPLLEMDAAQAERAFGDHLVQAQQIGRLAPGRVRAGGSLVFMGGTGGRRPRRALGAVPAVTNAFPALVATLALELAPVRANLIAAGFVDTPLSAALLGDGLDDRRAQLRATLPIGRVVVAEDVAALAVHLMANTALTGATYDIDGGQQFVE
jgi:NAD(P)-dependent dehydrogenase (short-subunit alcohol dehydrogenase family)